MVNRELIEVFSEIAREKNVERSELGSIIESLFLHLVERERGDASNCSVIVNLDKGEFEIYVEKDIVDDVEDPVMEITLVGTNADTSPACVSIIGSAVSDPVLPLTSPLVICST